jgi:RNA polymerase sigma-70 factor (ECF subfamily)
MRMVEQHLIQGILSKDKSAFDMLYRSYYKALVCIANNILSDNQLAEEAVQDVFIKLWKTGSNLFIDTSLSSYLTRMVHNRCIDYLRENDRRIKTISIENQEIRTQLHQYGIDNMFDEELFADDLEILINLTITQLPPQCRQVFTLSRFDGLTHKEIAEKLQISVSTVKTQITRALIKLNKTVSGYYK